MMKISIITPTFNSARYLRDSLGSILAQRGEGFEVESIVIDGGSADGTVDYLRGLNDPRVRWVSEKDRGQSDAINKGLAMAGGDVVAWLNADDLYTPGALIVVRTDSAGEAAGLLGQDPFWTENLITDRQIREWGLLGDPFGPA